MTPGAQEADVFVGRERELAELEAGLGDALAGRGRLFLIGGEPGIGKTRLVDELSSRAKGRGARVLWGRCWEAGGAPAYWPWVQALRSYVREQDPDTLLVQFGSGAPDIAQILPELQDLLPELRLPVPSDPEGARFRLFDSMFDLLRTVAQVQPLVLVLDDLQAADAPSLLLLRFVASEMDDAHVLVVGLYRDDVPENPQLTSTVAEVARNVATRQISLSGLGRPDVATLIETTVDARVPPAVIEAVQERTEGNPLFVSEVIRLLVAERRLEDTGEATMARAAIPARIREVIGRRLALLSDRCRRALSLASVLGREFRLDALARASGLGADELLQIVDEAVAARVVTEAPAAVGRMRFSHGLVRDVVFEGLTTAERVRIHRDVGEMLEDLYAADPEPHLAELAHHFCEAAPGGDVDKAIGYASRAAERAAALLAYEDGVRLFRLAIQIQETKSATDPEARCRLLLGLGDCQAREGDLEGAKETFLLAADVAEKRNLSEQLAAAALGYGGRFVWARAGSDRRLVPLLERALRSLPTGDNPVRARLMARLAGALRDERSPDELSRLSQEAVEIARRTGNPATLSYALAGRFAATWGPDNAEERLGIATEILQLAIEAGDRERILEGRDWRMVALHELGDIAAVDTEIHASSLLVDELRQPAQRWLVLASLVMRALFDGRFDEAERLIPEAIRHGDRAQRWDAVLSFGIESYMLRREQGRLGEMEPIIAGSVAAYPTRPVLRCVLAHLYLGLGRTDDARRVFDRLAADGFSGLRKDNDWLFEMSLLAEVADHLADADRAGTLLELLRPYAGRHATSGGEVSTGSMARSVGILAATLGRWAEAESLFELALDRNAAMGSPPWVAYTQYEYARMLIARDEPGDRERAADLLAEAAATGERLGMVALGRKVGAILGTEGAARGRVTPKSGPGTGPLRAGNVFRREGEYWSITFEGETLRLKDSKGLHYLAQLLANPGQEFLALELVTAGRAPNGSANVPALRGDTGYTVRRDPGGSGELLDAPAREAYRRRLQELESEIDEAEERADRERAARARDERDLLARELTVAMGLGGRARKAPSDAERARVNVTKAIKAALARIRDQRPALWRHLANTIRTGTFCSYAPDPRVPTTWHV